MALNAEFFDKIAAKLVEEGEQDDLAKFMLAGKESFEAVQNYFRDLEADKKKKLFLKGDTWSLGFTGDHSDQSLFKSIASSIIPFVDELYLIDTCLDDCSFLKDIQHLKHLYLMFVHHDYLKAVSHLSNLQSVDDLFLSINSLNIQILSSFSFSFNSLRAYNFIFEADPKRNKIFPAQIVQLYGDWKLMNDFVFNRQNYQNYADIFPNATQLFFVFNTKVVDDVSDLLKISNPNYADEVNISNRNILFYYEFCDYSGFPESKVLKVLQDDENWDTGGCPYKPAYSQTHHFVTCSFPLAVAEVGKRIAQSTLRRIPENSDGQPEDYYRIIIDYETKHEAEFEVLKTASVETLLKAYREITEIDDEHFCFEIDDRIVSDGIIADNFQDGDKIAFRYRH